MQHEAYTYYAPYIIMVIVFADFQKEKADFMQYIAENYVSDKTYRDNHTDLQKQLAQIHTDINDVKNILIKRGI